MKGWLYYTNLLCQKRKASFKKDTDFMNRRELFKSKPFCTKLAYTVKKAIEQFAHSKIMSYILQTDGH